jgi:DNA-binding CsgD family transcriptional regulator
MATLTQIATKTKQKRTAKKSAKPTTTRPRTGETISEKVEAMLKGGKSREEVGKSLKLDGKAVSWYVHHLRKQKRLPPANGKRSAAKKSAAA